MSVPAKGMAKVIRAALCVCLVVALSLAGLQGVGAAYAYGGTEAASAAVADMQRMSATGNAAAAQELQTIVDQAGPGETLVLKRGTYRGPVVIRKPLVLRAEIAGEAILLNASEESALTIEADDVTVSGIVVRDEALKEAATIRVSGDRAVLRELRITTGTDGITAKDANDGTVIGTEIEWSPEGVPTARKGNGIDLFNSHRWQVENNVVRGVHDGIYMESSDDTSVIGNRIEDSRYGIHCMYTSGTVIRGNEGHANITGAMVMTTREVEVTNNVFTKQSENVHSQGILLFDAHDSLFESNTVEGNRAGFYIEQSTGNRFVGNRVAYNFLGLQLLDAERNVVEGNLFQGNVADAQARGSRDNDIAGNYWDGFRGIDADGDGYSDTTYAINPLFQELTQKRAAFQLFFQSPGMVFLEGLYQTDRDEWSSDRSPLMMPPDIGEAEGRSPGSIATGIAGLALLGAAGLLLHVNRRRTS